MFLICLDFYFSSRIRFSDRSIKALVAISTIIMIDLIAEFIPREDINLVGKNLTLKEIVDIDFQSGAGYKLRDGSYNLDVKVMRDGSQVSSYQSEYTIKNSQRVMKDISSPECKDILLIGGSHNFGQAIPDQHTLQFSLDSYGYNSANISAPGYGLVNNIAILKELKNKHEEFWECPPKYVIYRFINDHINRDNAKTMFSPYGVHIEMVDDTYSLKRNYTDVFNGLSYLLTKYIPTRIFWYGANSDSELSFRLISQQLQRLWFFTDNDIERSAFLLGNIDKLWEGSKKKPKIIVLIDAVVIDEVAEKYINHLQNLINIEIILPEEPKLFFDWASKNCLDLPYRTHYIPYENHPTGCLNKFYSEKIFIYLSSGQNAKSY